MRSRRPSSELDAARSRRLAQLGDELAGLRPARPEPSSPVALTQAPWWDDHTRPAPSRPPAPGVTSPDLPVPDGPVPDRPVPDRPVLAAMPPRPGRHAGRRAALSARLGTLALGPAQLAVVAVLVALGLAATCWWLVRGSAHPSTGGSASPLQAAPALTSPSAAVDPVGAGAGGPAAQASPATVTVDVAGKVRHPGIAVLDAGARVVDALEAAGGARAGVDLTGLNLARVLVDGEQVVVGVPAQTGAAAAAASPPGSSPGSPGGQPTLVDLNTATEAELDTLPDVGPVTAASILAWRDQHGGFTSVDELLEVDGIGEVTLGKLAPFVTV